MPGFPRILRALSEAYRTERESVEAQARELTEAIASVSVQKGAAYTPGPDLLERASAKLLERWDAAHGGFATNQQRAPKFPNTMPLELLMRAGHSKEVTQQLLAMRRGGIWDHLGGGFHRYSTDREWLVPHFEKMLYDNALLLRTYVDASRAYDEPAFANVARDIAKYIEREMTDPDGGFYASQDADSEGMEGAFFVWSPADIEAALGGDAPRAMEHFGVSMAGNMESTPSTPKDGRPTFKTVLSAVKDGDVSALKERMFAWREKRPKPFRDEKVLTSWSALMISALAEAGMALKEPLFLPMAERAFAFLLLHCVEGGRVSRLAKKIDGKWQVKKPGFLDDHAFLANAALDLYEATGTNEYVTVARTIVDAMLVAFDGFAFTPNDGETLITRAKDPFDNAIPSGASMAYRALLRLGTLLGGEYAHIAETELGKLAPAAVHNPFAYGQSLCELDRVVSGSIDIVIVGAKSDPRTQALIHAIYNSWLANRNVAWVDPAGITAAPALAEGKPAHAEPVVYVCRGRACSLPVTTPSELLPLLR
jgi:uncharacterized protein YyaL (SSP411 family)